MYFCRLVQGPGSFCKGNVISDCILSQFELNLEEGIVMIALSEVMEKIITVGDDWWQSLFRVVELASVFRLLSRCSFESGLKNIGVKSSIVSF